MAPPTDFGKLGRAAVGGAGHQGGDGTRDRPAVVRVVGVPGRHEQRAQVRVADAELPVGPGSGGYLLGREVSKANGDIHRRDDELGDLLKTLNIEGVVIAQELQQVDAGQVAGRVVQVDVLGTVRDHRAADDVGVVPRFGE